VAVPRRQGAFYILGYALDAPVAQQMYGVKSKQGHSPKNNPAAFGGA